MIPKSLPALLQVDFFYRFADGSCFVEQEFVLSHLVKPKWLCSQAESRGALFASCPLKYGCRQFLSSLGRKGGAL